MPAPAGPPAPGILPKAILTTARIAHKPAHVPGALTNSALTYGGAVHQAIGGASNAAKESVAALEPRGPAKLITSLLERIDASAAHSAGKAVTSAKVFWKPVSDGAEQLGQAMVNPGVYMYAKKAGFADPADPKLLAELTHTKGYPTPPPPEAPAGSGGSGGGTPPAPPSAAPSGDPAGGQPQPPAGDGAGAPADAPPGVAPPGDTPANDGPPAVAPTGPASGPAPTEAAPQPEAPPPPAAPPPG